MLNIFATDVNAMLQHTSQLNVISDNINNINTSGYRRVMGGYKTMTGHTIAGEPQTGGMKHYSKRNMEKTGNIAITNRALDVSITGKGMFVVQDPYKKELRYTKAGNFQEASLNPKDKNHMTLTDKNGNVVMGYATRHDGAITSNRLVPIDVNYNKSIPAIQTTFVKIGANLPAININKGDHYKVNIAIIGPSKQLENIDASFVFKGDGHWVMHYPDSTGKVREKTIQFDSQGVLVGGRILQIDDKLSVDISGMTQKGENFVKSYNTANGRAAGKVESIRFNELGQVLGSLDTGGDTILYSLALGKATSPTNLEALSGNVYSETSLSGKMSYGTGGPNSEFGTFNINSLELSNVALDTEFTDLITTQRAYQAASKALQAGDSMLKNLNNLK